MQGLKHLWSRSVWLLSAGILVLLIASLCLLIYSSWRHGRQLDPVQNHLRYIAAIETVETSLRNTLVGYLEKGPGQFDISDTEELRSHLSDMAASADYLDEDTPQQLRLARQQLDQFDGTSRNPIDQTLLNLRVILTNEITAHSLLVESIRRSVYREQRITVALATAMLLVAPPLWLMVRRRILVPLENMGYLMTLLRHQDYTPVPTSDIDPMLLPLFTNYNRLVGRWLELEQERQLREESLSDAVHQATGILLQQQRRLAQAERLGAVGEVIASVAHELRNPLSSIQMALQNLSREITDRDHLERIDMILKETKRISMQLSTLLENARHEPERLQEVRIDLLLEELCRLVRYQVHKDIKLNLDVQVGSTCRLPEMQFHQCLLNLMLNAAQMLGDGPGEIRVRAAMQEQSLKLVVRDNGPGFPTEMLDGRIRTFATFRKGGSGLGLVMVKRFVTEAGGSMELSNVDPHGAQVELIIPCGTSHG